VQSAKTPKRLPNPRGRGRLEGPGSRLDIDTLGWFLVGLGLALVWLDSPRHVDAVPALVLLRVRYGRRGMEYKRSRGSCSIRP
jgi:hypothetical protein